MSRNKFVQNSFENSWCEICNFSQATISGYEYKTFTTSGTVSTPLLGDDFDVEKFSIEEYYVVYLQNPFGVYDDDSGNYNFDTNYTIEIEYDIEQRYECITLDHLLQYNFEWIWKQKNNFQEKLCNKWRKSNVEKQKIYRI